MTSRADLAMLADFLQFVIDGKRPALSEGTLTNGIRWTWIGDGIVRFDPPGEPFNSVVVSAGTPRGRNRPCAIPATGNPGQHRSDAGLVPLSRRRSQPVVRRPASDAANQS